LLCDLKYSVVIAIIAIQWVVPKKKPYSIPRRLFGNSKGEGVAKAKVLKEKSLPKKATFMRIS